MVFTYSSFGDLNGLKVEVLIDLIPLGWSDDGALIRLVSDKMDCSTLKYSMHYLRSGVFDEFSCDLSASEEDDFRNAISKFVLTGFSDVDGYHPNLCDGGYSFLHIKGCGLSVDVSSNSCGFLGFDELQTLIMGLKHRRRSHDDE